MGGVRKEESPVIIFSPLQIDLDSDNISEYHNILDIVLGAMTPIASFYPPTIIVCIISIFIGKTKTVYYLLKVT